MGMFCRRDDGRGFALITALLFVTVLALLVGGLLMAVRHDKFRTLSYTDDVAATYLGEAGVADVIDRIMDDPSFSADLIDVAVPGRPGSYSVTWSDPALAGPQSSINNLAGAATVNGPRGPNTVPPHSVELVVVAKAGHTERVTQLILLAPVAAADATPMAATGNIYLRGNISVDSIDGILGGYVSGGKTIHSNSRPGTVRWRKENSTDIARFDGDVSCSCSQTTAVNLEGSNGTDYFADNEQRAVPTISLPSMDVARAVGDNSSHPAPTLSPTGPTILPAGSYYVGGGLSLPDNLVLEDGANLFVSGNLDVDGSISGTGKIMVDGRVQMRGSEFIGGGQDQFVSLFASGNLTLSGFDGEDRLAQLAGSDPALAANLASVDTALGNLNAALAADDEVAAQTARAELGEGAGAQLFEQIRAQVAADPSYDETTAFLERKLDVLSDYLGDYQTVTGSGSIMSDNMDGTSTGGFLDFALQRSDSDLKNVNQTLLGQVTVAELGHSHFRGMLYSNGRLRIENGVSVLGSALADDGRGGGSFNSYLSPVDGTTYTPAGRMGSNGTIRMEGGTRLTIDKAMMAGGGGGGASGGVRIGSWLRR